MSLIETAHRRTLQAANALLFASLLLAMIVFRWSVELFGIAVLLMAAVHFSAWAQQLQPVEAFASEPAGRTGLQ